MPDLARALEHGPTELAASYLGMSATDTLVALATVGATALLLPLPTESRAADGSAPSSVSLATAAASIAGSLLAAAPLM